MLDPIGMIVHVLLIGLIAFRVLKYKAKRYFRENIGLLILNLLLLFSTDIRGALFGAIWIVDIFLLLLVVILVIRKRT